MKTAVPLLQSIEFEPEFVFGRSIIKNKAEMLAQLALYRRVITVTLVLLYGVALTVAISTIMFAYTSQAPLMKGLLPYAGGAAFVGLLEFARRLTREWILTTLPLAIARHASDEQLKSFIGQLLSGIGKSNSKRTVGTAGTAAAKLIAKP